MIHRRHFPRFGQLEKAFKEAAKAIGLKVLQSFIEVRFIYRHGESAQEAARRARELELMFVAGRDFVPGRDVPTVPRFHFKHGESANDAERRRTRLQAGYARQSRNFN